MAAEHSTDPIPGDALASTFKRGAASGRYARPVSAKESEEQQQSATELLANRLRTLMDVVEARTGEEVTFTAISDYLSGRGVTLSRSRWSYILNGHRRIDDVALLDALSDFFEMPHGYLRGEAGVPEPITAQLDLVRAMRAAKVRSFAARTLGDLSPETLSAITTYLDKEAARVRGPQS